MHTNHGRINGGHWALSASTTARSRALLVGAMALALGIGLYAEEAQAEVIVTDHSAAPLVVRDSVETTSGAPTTLDVDLDGDGDVDMRFGHVHQYAPWAGNVRTWSAINLYWPTGLDLATWVGEPHFTNPERFTPSILAAGDLIDATNSLNDGWSGGDPAGWIAARYYNNLNGEWYSTDGTSRRGYIGFQTSDGRMGWIDLEARHDNLNASDSANNHLIIHGWAYETEIGVPIEAGSTVSMASADADGDGVEDDDDLCPGVDDAVFTPELDDNVGFEADIDLDGEDVVITWDVLSSGSGTVEIWRATDPADLPSDTASCARDAGPTAVSLYSGTELSFTDPGAAPQGTETPTYFYRLMSDGVEIDSVVLAKVTTPVYPGNNLIGLCTVGNLETISDADALFEDAANRISQWNPVTQRWDYWWTAIDSGSTWMDFDLSFGGVIVVNFDANVQPYRALVGRVPTAADVPLAPFATGNNVVSLPLLSEDILASEYRQQQGLIHVEYYDPQTQSATFYTGAPGDVDFTMSGCGAYGMAR
ncbi:MAG: hypothetical protein AAF799_32470 [Myxococcota bacterium]